VNTPLLHELLDHLRTANRETEWVEFKVNNDDPDDIGEYISALANSAALAGKRFGYVVWGVSNVTHDVVGTTVRLHEKRIGAEEFEGWVTRLLSPRVNFRIVEGVVNGAFVSLLEIPAASHTPVRFKDHEYIRIGSYKKKLRDYPEKERELWRILEKSAWESDTAVSHVPGGEVLSLIDFPAYFEMTKQPLPETRPAVLAACAEDGLIEKERADFYNVTNLGAILFARDLSRIPHLSRKTVRLVIYKGRDRTETLREQPGQRGYAIGFGGLVTYLNDLLPANEQITQAFRTEVRVYPEIAIRELIANALIHQDFRVTGTGPIVEVFSDRIEVTNPGTPLIDTKRFLDAPPRSRNEKLAALMRRMNICEERGSGIDKIITAAEVFQLPAPRFDVPENHTKATLYAPRALSDMDKEDRIRACYQHAALRYVSNDQMTNTSLRDRFAIAPQNYSIASRIIAETMDAKLIKRADPESTSKKHARYVPFWA
jgi:predicted HTH transcriptional regulator